MTMSCLLFSVLSFSNKDLRNSFITGEYGLMRVFTSEMSIRKNKMMM